MLFRRRAIRIGQPIVVKVEDYLSHEEIPIEFMITSVWIAERHDYNASAGYKFLIVRTRARNMGRREVSASFPEPVGLWEVRVDNGNIYKAKGGGPFFSLRPGEVKEEDMAFEILASTQPIECYTTSEFGEQYVLDVRAAQNLASPAVAGFCPRCGTRSAPTSKYCSECGTKLSD